MIQLVLICLGIWLTIKGFILLWGFSGIVAVLVLVVACPYLPVLGLLSLFL